MGGCCEPQGYEAMFGRRFARHVASRYRKRGLDKTATRMVAFLTEQGIEGASVLEIGGGVAEIQLELLRHGARRTTNLELVAAYDADAASLARAAGVDERMTRRVVDIARSPEAVEPHDVVVLHRVVCCYPDYERLLTAASDHALRLLVFSHPPLNPLSRLITAAENATFWLSRKSFRTFTHPPAAMRAVAESRGLKVAFTHRGTAWHAVGLAR